MSAGGVDLYELLEVEESVDQREISLAFRRLAKRWHPDLNSACEHDATERMKQISAAYEVLRDPDRRADYDLTLRAPAPTRPPEPTVSDAGQRSAASAPAAWWAFTASAAAVTVVADPGPPPGYPPAARRVWARAAPSRRPRRAPPTGLVDSRRAASGPPGAADTVGLVVCPFLTFLLAAWCGREYGLARWGVLYALAPVMWRMGNSTASPALTLAGWLVIAVGALHCLWWRRRLYDAVTRGGGEVHR